MRVLWLSNSAAIGGAELCLAEAVDALSARGHEVHVVLPMDGPLRERLVNAAGVHVCWSDPWATHRPVGPARRLRQAARNHLVAAPELCELAQRIGANVVVSNTLVVIAGALTARRARLPHVWFLQEFGMEDHRLRLLFGRTASFAFMRRRADVFMVNSEALRDHYSRWLPAAKLRRVHYAVETPTALPNGRPPGPFRLVLVGAWKTSKGQREAIAAVQQVRESGLDVRLDLVGREGEPGFEAELRRAAEHSNGIRLIDFHPNPELDMSRSDATLMCSHSEAFGRVTIEAMKLGKPVIGASCGATSELVRHGWNGLLYRRGDSADLARQIVRLATDPAAALEMGRRGHEWACETFNSEHYGADLEAALSSASPAP